MHDEELEKLNQYKRDFEWFQESFNEILTEFTKKFIAIRDQAIVDNDNNSSQLLERLKEKYNDISPFLIEYVDKRKLAHVL
jgi:Family of unknown function (DUF5678)